MATVPSEADECSESSSEALTPCCNICLDLEWAHYDNLAGEWNTEWERAKTVTYYELLSAKNQGCRICTLLSGAISEFRKPLLALPENDIVHLVRLESSSATITLRKEYTTTLEVRHESLEGLSYFELELYTQAASPSPWVALGAANEISSNIDIPSVMKFLQQQITHCRGSHKLCWPTNTIPKLPSRVLYVGSERQDLSHIRLEKSLGRERRYTALSHCWGTTEGMIKTTKANIQERSEAIAFSRLPKTFQDAVLITRALEIDYLWIDSLCIIQDDTADWEAESIKMADVYSLSYLTIAATGSANSFGGCLFPRWYETPRGLKIPHSFAKLQDRQLMDAIAMDENLEALKGVRVRYLPTSHNQLAGYDDERRGTGHLLTRAWTFQERILSNRILHFLGDEMVWECQERTSCECGYSAWEGVDIHEKELGSPFHKSVKNSFSALCHGNKTQAYIYQTWYDILEAFKELDITRETDRLPAVSGLASRISERLDDAYMAGLWKGDLSRGLLWHKLPSEPSHRIQGSEGYHIPSWSWASVGINNSSNHRSLLMCEEKVAMDKHFQIVNDISIGKSSLTSFTSLEDPPLKISGLAKECTLHLVHNRVVPGIIVSYNFLDLQNESEFVYVDIEPDCDNIIKDQPGIPVLCILIGDIPDSNSIRLKDKEEAYPVQCSLVFQKRDSGVYERVGLSVHDPKKGSFIGAQETIIEIV